VNRRFGTPHWLLTFILAARMAWSGMSEA